MQREEAEAAADAIWRGLVVPRLLPLDEIQAERQPYSFGLVGLAVVEKGTVPGGFALIASLQKESDKEAVLDAIAMLLAAFAFTEGDSSSIDTEVTGPYAAFSIQPGSPIIRRDSIGRIAGPSGSFGAVVLKQNIHYLLGAEHILNDFGQGFPGDRIHWDDQSTTDGGPTHLAARYDVIGPDYTRIKKSYLDCGLAALFRKEPFWSEKTRCFGSFRGQPAAAAIGQVVKKCGPVNPSLTYGKVESITARAVVLFRTDHYGNIPLEVSFEEQVRITSEEGQRFAQPGDSGSVVALADNLQAPVGLLFAGTESGKVFLANPMTKIQKQLKFDHFV